MSLILEALKKSEQQRRLGEAPTLSSPVLATRKPRSLLPFIAVAIVIALGAGWWLTRERAPLDAGIAAKVPAAAPVDPTRPIAATTPPKAPVSRDLTTQRSAPMKETPANPHAVPAAPIVPAPASDRPGSASLPPGALLGGPGKAGVDKATAAAPAATPRAAPNMRKVEPPPTAAEPHRGPEPVGPDRPTTTAPPVAAATAPAVSAATKAPAATATAKTSAPDLPLMWELPYSTRKDLPELTLTMHVYASEPAERFVVVKGERHIVGDDLGNGLILREIRPDGIVLEFKGQRFVYPRDGR